MTTKTYTVTWNRKIGDEIWYLYIGDMKKGIIEELIISEKYGTSLLPAYEVRYKNGDFGTNSVNEEDILVKRDKYIKDFERLNKQITKKREEYNAVKKEFDDLQYKVKYNR